MERSARLLNRASLLIAVLVNPVNLIVFWILTRRGVMVVGVIFGLEMGKRWYDMGRMVKKICRRVYTVASSCLSISLRLQVVFRSIYSPTYM